jgi:hypothetical protein
MVTWFIIIDLKGHLEIMTAMADVITTKTKTTETTINQPSKTASMSLRFFYW